MQLHVDFTVQVLNPRGRYLYEMGVLSKKCH